MNTKYIQFHLSEAHHALTQILEALRTDPAYD